MSHMAYNWFWILIPLAAIGARTFRTWMRFQATQHALGTSTHELEKEVRDLQKIKAELVDRLQNLEAIVVSQTWGALHEKGLSPAEQELKVASAVRRELSLPDSTPSNQQRAEQLAQRLR